MEIKQRTLSRATETQGVSLHTGERVTLRLLPAAANQGIVFRRVDLPGAPEIPAHCGNVGDLVRNTTLVSGHAKVHTVEHVVSALAGMGVDNAIVELDASEPPIMDGSSKAFVEIIAKAGVEDLDVVRNVHRLESTISVVEEDRSLVVLPYDGFRISCTFSDSKGRFTQYYSIDLDPESYANQIAPARTFTFYEDIEALVQMGKIKGGSLESALVIKDEKVLSKEPLRFENEFVRHKILDLVGDLALAGKSFRGHVIAVKPGHAINSRLAKLLSESFKSAPEAVSNVPAVVPSAPVVPVRESLPSQSVELSAETETGIGSMAIGEVLKALPHRYPFLMVDRVLEISGSRLVAIKNVTINEPYFVGHFPAQPVMPGVLQIEAMAQAAGILFLKMIGKTSQVALFMSCDGVKFRRSVEPGDQIRIEVEMKKTRAGKMGIAAAECKVAGQVVSSAELMFTIVS